MAVLHLAGGAEGVHRGLGHPLVELRPHQLEDRALGAGDAVALHGGHGSVSVELQGSSLDRELRDALPDQRVRAAADPARVLGELCGRDLGAGRERHAERASLV